MAGATTSVRMGGTQEPELVAPAHVVEGPNGSVIVDPSKVETPKPVDKNRPEWLPEKFTTPEDMAKAYLELEKKQGTKPVDPPVVTPEAAKAKGIDLDALSKEYAEKGELSPESLKALNDKGFTKAHVDAYVTGLQAQATQTRATLAEVAGGEEQLTNVLKWSEVNLSTKEKAAYNSLLDTGNVEGASMLLSSIVAKYTAANGTAPTLLNGERVPGNGGVKPFKSNAEVVDAMSAKDNRGRRRYEVDEAYRQEIAQRISVSDY